MSDLRNRLQLIIPMAGSGQRFVAAGYDTPKFLLPVDAMPVIEHVVGMFPSVETKLICNTSHLTHSDKLAKLGKIVWIPPHKKGPVFTVNEAFDEIDDDRPVVVAYCDCAAFFDFSALLKHIESEDPDGCLLCHIGFHPHMLGSDHYAFCRTEGKRLLEIREKQPFTNNRSEEYASTGSYYFKNGRMLKDYFQRIQKRPGLNGEHYVSLVYNPMVQDGLKVTIFEVDKMMQWGTPYDYEEYQNWSRFFFARQHLFPEPLSETTLIVPMAGKGSRFSRDGYYEPKPLIDVDGFPMFVRAVDCLPPINRKVFVILREHTVQFSLDQVIRVHFPDAKIVILDEVTEGQAITCQRAIEIARIPPEQPIMISSCDNGVHYNPTVFSKLIESDFDAIVWSFRNNQTSRVKPDSYSWLAVDSEGKLNGCYVKHYPFSDSPLKHHAIIGTMYFRAARLFLDALQRNVDDNIRTKGEFYVDDLLQTMLNDRKKIRVFESSNFLCWGTPDDLKVYNYWKDYFFKRYGVIGPI